MRLQNALSLLLREWTRQEENKRAIVSAFDEFAQEFKNYDRQQLRRGLDYLEHGLVEITQYGQHIANGLLVTDDGYFVTAEHCVRDDLSKLKIKTHDGSTYKIERVCAVGTRFDVALAKAKISAETSARKYYFYNGKKMEALPVAVMTRRNGTLETLYGIATGNSSYITVFKNEKLVQTYDNFNLILSARPGDSGGIILTPDSSIMGLLSTGNKKNYASGIEIRRALELVNFYGNHVSEKIS